MKVTICIINYNDKLRVARAINSALNQTWQDKEVIVVDDGSDAETRAIYQPFFDRVKLIQLERHNIRERNPSRPRNVGLTASTGDFICFLDSDNYYDPRFVEESMKNIKDISFCDWEIIGLDSYKIKMSEAWDLSRGILENYLAKNHLDHQCLIVRTELLKTVGGYDERLPRSQDCDVLVRLMMGTSCWSYADKPLFFFEKHEKDQNKGIASIYGKTLWTLKNELSPTWLFPYLKNPAALLAFIQAFNAYMTDSKWKAESKKLRIAADRVSDEIGEENKEPDSGFRVVRE